jgi:tetratricopeptide (TPR) repeat protein
MNPPSKLVHDGHPGRPPWAKPLDRLAQRLGRLLSWIGRPSDQLLEELARVDRGPRPVLPQAPAVPGGSLDQARAALERGELGEALHRFGLLTEHDPGHAWAWHGRGDALQLAGEPFEALSAYSRAAALAPSVGLHQGGRFNALRTLGRLEEAEQAWAEALRLDPGIAWMRR